MPLHPDALALVEMTAAAFPGGLHALPIEQVREKMAAAPLPPGPDVADVQDFRVAAPEGHQIPIRVYRPTTTTDTGVLVWLHGGAWALGSLDGADAICREIAVASGQAVVSVDYRLAPEHPYPAGLDDCYAVVEWVARHGAEHGVDTSRIAVGGDSAGGNLAAAVTIKARDDSGPALALQILAYPTVQFRISSYEHVVDPVIGASMVHHFWGQYVGADENYLDPLCAPMAATSLSGLPPALVVVPEVDLTRADQEVYAARLATAGVLATSRVYLGMPHGFLGMSAALETAREAITDIARALRAHLSH